jgi:hypothetical protein
VISCRCYRKYKNQNMIDQFETLILEERELLLRTPVLLSVFTACSDKQINRAQKADAIKLSHLKPFTADPSLIPFYKEVEKNFEQDFELISKQYSPFDEESRRRVKSEIKRAQLILGKLNRDYASKLLRSFEKYERHVRRAAHSVVEDFVFPVPIRGFNA